MCNCYPVEKVSCNPRRSSLKLQNKSELCFVLNIGCCVSTFILSSLRQHRAVQRGWHQPGIELFPDPAKHNAANTSDRKKKEKKFNFYLMKIATSLSAGSRGPHAREQCGWHFPLLCVWCDNVSDKTVEKFLQGESGQCFLGSLIFSQHSYIFLQSNSLRNYTAKSTWAESWLIPSKRDDFVREKKEFI